MRAADWIHLDHVGATLLPAIRAAGVATPVSLDGGNPIPGLSLAGIALYAPTVAALLARAGTGSPEAALEAALDEGARIVVATDGPRGSIAAWREGARTRRVSAPAPSVPDLVSTLGAGDVFHGALLAALLENHPIADALVRANLVAAASTRALDGRSAIPRRADLEAMLATGVVTTR
jgi:sulfofructose kinase